MNAVPKIKSPSPFSGYLQVSGHAVDRASMRALETWQTYRRPAEGLYAWLRREAKTALTQPPDARGYRHHLGLRWAFDEGDGWPVLKTVIRDT